MRDGQTLAVLRRRLGAASASVRQHLRDDRASALRLALSAVLLAFAFAAPRVFARLRAAAFPAYRSLTKAYATALAWIASPVPFAMWDILILAIVLWGLVALVSRWRGGRPLLPVLSRMALVGALVTALFAGWALNHYAPPLADELGLELRAYSTDELAGATAYYLEEAARLAPELPRDEEGQLQRQDFFELARVAGSAYAPLAEVYPVFEGTTVPVKALLVWGPPLLYSGHTGMYWPATGEAGVPLDCAVAEEPFIMCHEAAHRLCIASEQEANFAAMLACATSEDARLRYSGAYEAFCYCLNALWRQDPERAQQLLQEVADEGLYEGVVLVLADRTATSEHYDRYEGGFEEVGRTVNDSYLRSFGEEEGVRSYGLVVDYLIVWWLKG